MATMLSNAAAAAMAGDGTNKGLLALMAGGSLVIYGTARPANPDVATSGQTVLATYTLPSPAASQSNGVLTLLTVAAVTIGNTATAVWYRIYGAAGAGAPLVDGDILTSAGDGLVVSTASFVSGVTAGALTGGTVTVPVH